MTSVEMNDFIVFVIVTGVFVFFGVLLLAAVFFIEDDVAREGADERRTIAMQWIESHQLEEHDVSA